MAINVGDVCEWGRLRGIRGRFVHRASDECGSVRTPPSVFWHGRLSGLRLSEGLISGPLSGDATTQLAVGQAVTVLPAANGATRTSP